MTKFGLVTIAKIDHVANLANTLCGLAGLAVQTDSFLPTIELSNAEATLMLANSDINGLPQLHAVAPSHSARASSLMLPCCVCAISCRKRCEKRCLFQADDGVVELA